jgi:biopolymer transport protein ExbB/TolQ
MSITKNQKIGISVIVLSLVVGIGGTICSIGWAFWALASVENAGIGSIGNSITGALIFTVVGLIGTIAGTLLLIFGRSKSA